MANLIVRVQSPDGTKRIECRPAERTALFMEKVLHAFGLPNLFSFNIYKDRDKKNQIKSSDRSSLAQYGIKHGDMVYLEFRAPRVVSDNETPSTSWHQTGSSASLPIPVQGTASGTNAEPHVTPVLSKDDVDAYLSQQDGAIRRSPDDRLCRHGPHAECVHCAPIEPYNEAYRKEHNIKFMSFHSYLRKLMGGADKGKFAALENISCKIKPGCRDHRRWPHGICTKCQPNAITLNRQSYRHVDNVMFENPSIVDRFLDYWRCTNHQRLGFLLGRYEVHKDVPLGIKATVSAIYEPPQEATTDSLKLLPDANSDMVEKIAAHLGLKRVGWIFTDLIAEDLQKGTVKYLRNVESYFLSAEECIMAGHFQNQHPNACAFSPDGHFGSKFVTVCVTGDRDHKVHMEGYQVSNQCMALVQDNCLVPTLDAPELGYVRESTNEQYVPDVFYKEKDTYGNEVTKMARPLPIEYLLVDLPVSTPVEPQFTFYSESGIRPFPVENRLVDGHIQDFNALAAYMRQFPADRFLEAISDFHVLLYIATMDTVHFKDAIEPLLMAVKTKSKEIAVEWSRSDQWATVEQLIELQASSPTTPPPHAGSGVAGASSSVWTCRHCTFMNQPHSVMCEMCGLPQ